MSAEHIQHLFLGSPELGSNPTRCPELPARIPERRCDGAFELRRARKHSDIMVG